MNDAPAAVECPETAEPVVSAGDVADFFLTWAAERGEEGVSNLKLQKLLYYAQAWHLGLYGTSLFPEKFQAWASGPVIPELFWRWKEFGIGPVPRPATVPPMMRSTAEFLDEVATAYMPYDVWQLHWKTRAEAPWLNARAGRDDGDPWYDELSEADMAHHFHALATTT